MPGELAALTAAFLWAVASVMFGRLGQRLPPLGLNLAKGAIAIGLLLVTLVLLGRPPTGLTAGAVGLLLISGGVGIGLGDTLYFAAINQLGPRRAILLETLAPPMAALIALAFLGETLTGTAWVGIGLTLVGVSWVVAERIPPVKGMAPGPGGYRGVIYGVLAALGQAVGAVLSRLVLAETAIDPLWSSLVRLLAGLSIILGLLRWRGQGMTPLTPLRSPRLLATVALTAFVGTYLAIYLQQMALKYAATGIAQALTSTSPLFILPLAAASGESVSPRAVAGAMVALGGISLLVQASP
ncbi:DMT family transporter [Nodosilinea sp. P-1105]|uniref:DMT family transporter n=1 Tax=Nodosilinea sp. P-1105 TaxID=2546229 RepID=UPI001469ADCA|nr:DMT family transporter [Nodosilinea sp. P-1105]NMF82461.1 DMT family transporter [Nodosilinea sp. P-1105]